MTVAIESRYTALAATTSCLSCGSAISHADVRPGQICVDLGSGRGTDVLRLAEQVGPTGHAWGIDLTEAMLTRARQAAQKLGVTNATFVRSSLERLELPNESADWVFSNCVLNHADDKLAVWREIHRVLKPGGGFVVSDLYAVEEIAPELKHDPAAVAECWAGAVSRDEYLVHIQHAGLREVRVLEESEPYVKGQARVASFTVAGRKNSST